MLRGGVYTTEDRLAVDSVVPGCPPRPLWVGREPPLRSLTLSFVRSVWDTGVEGTFFLKGQSCLVINKLTFI